MKGLNKIKKTMAMTFQAFQLHQQAEREAYREALKKTVLRKNSKEAKHFLECMKRGMYKIYQKWVDDEGPGAHSTIKELSYEHFLYEFNRKDGWQGLTGKNVNQLRLTNGVYSFHSIYYSTTYEVIQTPIGRRIKLIETI